MAPILKSLTILLATATIICGEKIKKSEKRGIADFGSGFSSSRLEGSGIKISTDFGKEMTLEEFRQNGYSFGNNNNADLVKAFGSNLHFGQDAGGLNLNGGSNFDFGKNLGNNYNFGGNFAAVQQNLNKGSDLGAYGIQGVQGVQENQGIQSSQSETNNENFGANAAQGNQGNNGQSSSVSYITQNIPVPVPQPYQVTVNRPVAVPVPHPVPITVPRLVTVPVPQPHPVPIIRPYPVTVNRPVPVPIPHPVPVPQRQEIPISVPQPYPVVVTRPVPVRVPQTVVVPVPQLIDGNVAPGGDANNQYQNNQEQSATGDEQKYLGNALQNEASSLNSVFGNHEFNQNAQNNQISHQLPASDANQINSHESESTANNGFVPSSGGYNGHSSLAGLQQQQQQQHQQQGLSQELQSGHSGLAGLAQGSHSGFQQGLQSSGHQSGFPQGLQSSEVQSVLAGIQQGFQSTGHASLGGPQQGLQSFGGHSSLAGHQQGLQSDGGQSPFAGHQQGLQSIGGHSSLAELQQSLQSTEGHSGLAGLSHGLQSAGNINQFQIAASQPKISGYSGSIDSEQGQRNLGHIQQALYNAGGHGYPVESNAYGAKM